MHIKSTLAIFLLSLSASSFADSTCGLIPNTDRIDGFSTNICPQNKVAQLMFSFGGEASTAGVGSLDGKAAQSIQDEMTDAQEQQGNDNSRLIGLGGEYAWKLVKIFSVLMAVFLAASFIIESLKGKTAGDEQNEAHYPFLLTIFFILFTAVIVAPGLIRGASGYQYLIFASNNISLWGEQALIQFVASYRQMGQLETTREGLDKDSTTLINGHTKAFAKAITSALVSKELLQQVNSPIYQFNFNISRGIDYQRYIPTSHIMERKGNQFTFKSMNPEKVDELLYSFAPMNFFTSPFAGFRTQKYLDAISYSTRYKNDSSIENIGSRVTQLKADLSESMKKTNDKNETYEYVVNSAVAVYFYDLRSNWIAKKVEELFKTDRLKAIGEAFINGICSENPVESGIGKDIITQKKGLSQCITNNWQQAGTKKSADYESFISNNIESIQNEIYVGLLSINNAYSESIENADINNGLKKIVQGGAITFFWNMNEVSNRLNFVNESTKNFSTLSFFNVVDPAASGTYVKDEWLKNHGFKFIALDMNDYVRRFFSLEDINKSSYVTQDAQTQIQDSLIKNSAATSAVQTYEQSTGQAFENTMTTFQRAILSSQSSQSGIQDFGINIIRTGTKALTWGASSAVLAKALDEFVSSSNKKNTVETATVSTDKKVKPKQTGKFSFFSLIQNFAATIAIPSIALAIAIGAMYAYVLPILSIFPFFIAYIILKLFLIIQITCSVFVLIAAFKNHTRRSLVQFFWNQLSLLASNCVSCVVVLLLFIMNYAITDFVLKAFFQILAPALADNLSQGSGSVMSFVKTNAMLFIAMYFLQIAVLTSSIALLNKFFSLYRHDYAYGAIINGALEKTLTFCHLASLGFTSILVLLFKTANKKIIGGHKR